jgi:acyl-CoA dehydrogenase
MDLSFSAEERAFQDEVRGFIAKNLTDEMKRATALTPSVFSDPDIGMAWQRALNRQGWGAPGWPVDQGGPDWTPAQRWIFETESARAGVPNVNVMGVKMVGPVIIGFGSPEQKNFYLPRILSGEDYWCQGYSEPGSGSDLSSLKTRAVRDGDHYIINGTKRFTTNSPHAGIFTIFARTGPKEQKTAGISAFLIERGTPGITVAPHYKKMGFRGSHTADVIFEDCRVPASALLGGREGVGFKTAMRSLDHARLHMSAVATGLSLRIIDEGVRYASDRVQFGKPISQFQLIQGMLADCEAEALASRAMIEKVSRMKDDGLPVTKETACCKYFTTEALGRIADRVLQIHGGYGYIKEYAIERLFRDARLFRIYEGTSQIQQLVVAREMLKQHAA